VSEINRSNLPWFPPLIQAIAFGLVLSLVASVIATSDGAPDSAAARGDDAIASVAVLVPDSRLDSRIVAMELRGSSWSRAVDRLDSALFAVAENDRQLVASRGRIAELRGELAAVDAAYSAVRGEAAALSAELADVEAILRSRALDRFVHFDDNPLLGIDDPSTATDAGRNTALGRRVDELQFSTREGILLLQDETATEERRLASRRVEVAAGIASTEAVIAQRDGRVAELAADVETAMGNVRSARWSAAIPGVDLSVVALDAYLNAESLLGEKWPECGFRWWMVAGVARIESRHGRFGGRSLRADGRVDRPIIGIALDGGPGVRAMADTDDGEFDGDLVWDRAVGPLQFIPETWSRRGRDGSGDGYADPQNIYDAAYSAGRYLCALGGNLGSRAGLRGAYFGYNNSSVYVADVIEYADRYAGFELPSPAADS
jgi:transglycosylase-like protein with SLT domain